uniref:Uncharacterized protein n=1 Tax=Strix occidentalis caurina TaxID=311401 RepID=A0A8D0FSK0_STROC
MKYACWWLIQPFFCTSEMSEDIFLMTASPVIKAITNFKQVRET